MNHLINLTSWPDELAYYQGLPGGLEGFLNEHRLQGVELIQAGPLEGAHSIRPQIIGWHLPFWPAWLDFYLDRPALKRQFPNEEALKYYYGSQDKEMMARHWRRELIQAQELGAQYCVLHVSHGHLWSCFNYTFEDSDERVIDTFAQLLGEVLEGLDLKLTLLFENLWWPGLTLLRPELVERLMAQIPYPRKGLMLDTGHLMNTNHSLQTQKEGIDYMDQVVQGLGPSKKWIQGVHLSASLSGALVRHHLAQQGPPPSFETLSLETLEAFQAHCFRSGEWVRRIDQHRPFEDPQVVPWIQKLDPLYLVHELLVDQISDLPSVLDTQRSLFPS